jgi:alanyl-tRNA synthetase
MTDRLYYTNSYTTQFTAHIIEHLTLDGRPAIILDRTCFYPTGGGQPHDTGILNGVIVVEVQVRDEDGAVLHILNSPLAGETVDGVVDWSRRFDHMQQHTGQHILTQAFVEVADAKTVGFHLSPDSVTIDMDKASLSDQVISEAELLANRIVQENRSVTARLRDANDVEDVRIRRLPKHLLTEGLRVIDIDGFDATACGGTHVAHTGEIGLIKVLKLEKRGDKIRVEFRCGGRALNDYQGKHRVISQLANEMNSRYEEVPDNVAKLRTELKAAQTALKETREFLIDYEAVKLLADAEQQNGFRLIQAIFEGRDTGELKLLASKLTASPGIVALLGSAGEKAQLIFARSDDLPYDMNALLKQAVAAFGGRGGGQPAMAQGGGFPADRTRLENVLRESMMKVISN